MFVPQCPKKASLCLSIYTFGFNFRKTDKTKDQGNKHQNTAQNNVRHFHRGSLFHEIGIPVNFGHGSQFCLGIRFTGQDKTGANITCNHGSKPIK
ncbi:hypothetical protein D3C87_1771590 [compost metagenome]